MMYLLVGGGLVLLFVGGEMLVRGAVTTAQRLGVSPMLIGLTLVGFGTSTPELVTSLQAAFMESPGIAVGNVVGSNIANILLIIGLAALIFPIAAPRTAVQRDGGFMIFVSVLFLGIVLYGFLNAIFGAALVALLIAYIVFTYFKERRQPDEAKALYEAELERAEPRPGSVWVALAIAVVGIALTIAGARFLVDGSIQLARTFGMSETLIGLTIVAVGTSAPELVASLIAALKKHDEIALGNIIGSNIYNILGILGITALIHPLTIPPEIAHLDIWVVLVASILLIVFAWTGGRISRIEGGVLLAGYVAYLTVLAANAGLI